MVRPLASVGPVRWRTRVVPGESSYGVGFSFVQELTGVLVRCPKCGQVACNLYRKQYRVYAEGPGYYLKCQSCHQKSYPRVHPNFVQLLREALPPAEMQEILDRRRSAPSTNTHPVQPLSPRPGLGLPGPGPTKGVLIAGLVILLIIIGGAAYLLLSNHSGGHAPFF